jgi:HK97 family phage major capsid protein
MSLSLAKKLREKRANIHGQMQAIVKKADDENRAMTSEEVVSFDKMDTELNDLRSQIDKVERHEERDRQLNESRGRKAGGRDEGLDDDESRDQEEEDEKRDRAMVNYIRNGMDGLDEEDRAIMKKSYVKDESRAQSVGTNSAGGYTVAPEFYRVLTEAQKSFGGMLDDTITTAITTETGATLPMPTVDETSQTGEIIGENAQQNTQDITFGQVNIGAFKFSTKIVLVSVELLQDTAFDITSYIAKALATRDNRIKNKKFTIGAGTTEPFGIVVKSTLGFQGLTGDATGILFTDLIELIHSVDPAYRQNARFMMHDSSLKVVKQLKDSQGRPLFLPGLGVKEPDTINGYPYVINQDMATMAANAKSILFGDLSKYFRRNVRDVTILRLTERYADLGQVGFLGFSRADGNLLDAGTHPVKYFQNSAT